MATGKEIRGKIKNFESTKKITKAMEMISVSKPYVADTLAGSPWFQRTLLFAVCMGLIGGLVPAARAARLDIVQALGERTA